MSLGGLLSDANATWAKAQYDSRNDLTQHIKAVMEATGGLTGQATFRSKLDKTTTVFLLF